MAPEPSRLEPPPPKVEAESEIAAVHRGSPLIPRPLSDAELDILSALAPTVRSPREAKRLLNLYRMLRSTRNLGESSRFLGSDDEPGEHQAVAILLGVLSASPRLLGRLTAVLNDAQTWPDAVRALHEDDDWTTLLQRLEPALGLVTLTDAEPFRRWAAHIQRFSFVLSPLAASTRPPVGGGDGA